MRCRSRACRHSSTGCGNSSENMADVSDSDVDYAPDTPLRVHRDAIDALDREILARLSERAMHAKAIGTLKADSGAPAWRPDREAQVLARLCAQNPGPLTDEAV